MPKKNTYEHVKQYIELDNNYRLLSKEYKSNKDKLEMQCSEGHIFWMRFNDFQQGQRCHECADRKHTHEYVKNYIESFQGYKLLSEEYVNNNKKLEIRCPEEHIFWISYASFQQGHRCPECVGKKKHTYEEVKNYIESFEGYKLLSKKYVNAYTKLELQCPEGHIFLMVYGNFQQGQRCPECSGKKKLTYNKVKGYIESFEGHRLLSKKYVNNIAKLEIQCPEGHIFWMTYGNFQNGCRCWECHKENRSTPNQEIIDKLGFCESIRETEDKQIEVKCTYCGEWHKPERNKLMARIRYVEGRNDFEHRLYCSQQCKDECPIYYQHLYPKGFNIKENDLYISAEYNLWRQTVLERENHVCQFCEGEANTVHHEHPQKTHPHMALDPDNGIACCAECHYKYGHKTGTECSTGILSSRGC